MKVSNVIKILKKIQNEFGDIDVAVDDGGYQIVERISVETALSLGIPTDRIPEDNHKFVVFL